MRGTTVTRAGPADPEVWEARLRRDTAAVDAWEALLGAPDRMARSVTAGVGPAEGPQFAAPLETRPWADREGGTGLPCPAAVAVQRVRVLRVHAEACMDVNRYPAR